jgi:AGZA family xanthine/uracil permease-like MFS transporter
MPLIIAPPTSVSIFFAVSMQQSGMTYRDGNASLLISGAALAFCGIFPPLGRFLVRMIPDCIQAGISVGIGLITALAGAIEVNLVVRGKYTILDMGELTPEVVTAIANLIIVAVLLHYHVKGAFCTGLIVGTFMWWIISEEWPHEVVGEPSALADAGTLNHKHIVLLIFNMFFLYILTLNGLGRSLSDLAQLTKPNGAIPRGKFLFLVTGLTTMLSGYLSGPPILISPESAAGIKAGAKTGLSTLVCGILFGISIFFAPIFAEVPAAGTAPLLIMVGVMMFGNAKRVDWADYKFAVPAYCVLFFIPFTYSILRGVAIGYVIYIMIGLFTGDMIQNIIDFGTNPLAILCPPKSKSLTSKEEDVEGNDIGEENEVDYAAVKEKQQSTFLGRTILHIQKVMDDQEMETGAIHTLEHM